MQVVRPFQSTSNAVPSRVQVQKPHRCVVARGFKVEVEHQGKTYTLDVPKGESILTVALNKKIDLPHDCKLGVCMTCPAKLVSGTVDQSASMLSDDVTDKGYALLCVAEPTSDCKIKTVSEEELLNMQLGEM